MPNTTLASGYFLDKIVSFNFDYFFNKRNRILLHILMWSVFSLLLFLSYVIGYKLVCFDAILLTIRMALVNIIVFYMLFYLLLPKIFSGSKSRIILLLVLVFPISIFVWMASTYFISILYYVLRFEVEFGELKGVIKMSADQTFLEAVAPKRMLSQTIIIISLLSPFCFAKILVEIAKLYHKKFQVEREKMALEIQNIQIEKDFLKAQLNPHFLFNTLNNLYGLTVRKDNLAPELILNLSDIMSYTLYESNTEIVRLEKELDFIKNYIALEKMRYADDVNIQVVIEGERQTAGLFVAPLLTFTFIENAFKYGLKNTKNAFIKLEIKIENNTFWFSLENDLEETENESGFGGIGVENVRKRLELLYPNQYELEIKRLEKSFKVDLKLVLRK
ncbi:sensor histidine kinase YesM [Flavobacterium nitrogenifigens]|uniref:Sensor histidine kinase YesM n=2 Tax=Flavobacterium TaxID=237 RepID=A0A7W7IZH9_9FLAO|nr:MULTISPECIES: histidine kinase [Flavobacterium]MBB4802770.1 sensor histidine kinase YesM [Flavobacterium nitrogenifigens]MBB6387728.1 sensor histidine kinase YesM [Flavobacterium notoginsengisoli]